MMMMIMTIIADKDNRRNQMLLEVHDFWEPSSQSPWSNAAANHLRGADRDPHVGNHRPKLYIIYVIEFRKLRWTQHVACLKRHKNAHIFVAMSRRNGPHNPGRRQSSNTLNYFRERGCEGVNLIRQNEDKVHWRAFANTTTSSRIHNSRKSPDKFSICQSFQERLYNALNVPLNYSIPALMELYITWHMSKQGTSSPEL
jgi:hypothetical protein